MNAPSGNHPENLARQRLAAACRAMDRAARLRWMIVVCQILVALVLGLALADYWLLLPVMIRATGALALAALLVLGAVRLLRFFLRPTHLKQGALAIESKRPDLGCEVSTAAEYLAGERKMEHEYEPELAAALEAKTATALAESAPISARLLLYAVLLGLTVLLFTALVLLVPGGLTALERTAVPFSNAHYTAVAVQPGNFEIAVGRDAAITNVFSGRLPKDARISWAQKDTLRWQTAALTGGTQGVYIHTLTNLQTDVVYRVAGSDALSPDYHITTYIPPTVRDFDIHVTYPAYTRHGPSLQKSPDISAVRASTAEIRIQPSVGLKEANLRFSNRPGLALSPHADGSWSGSVPLSTNSEYWIELADVKGHPGVNEKPYHLVALPDNPPTVEISDPGKDIRSSATNQVLVKISVADDFGVDKIKLVYNKLGGSQQTVEATRESEHNGQVIATAELDLSPLELKQYELVAYHAEASDNNTLDGPGVGKSAVYFIEITDEQAGKSLGQTQGQQVNLLVIQKQIIADTTALAASAPADQFKDLAVRQRDAAEFGRMYLEAISDGGAEAAVDEMHAAITDMELAGKHLENQKRSQAIPSEESALAHLYQVVKLMPELGNLPTTQTADQKPPPSPKVKVVLEAIKQKKKEQPDNKEIQEALNQAKDLARAQSGLNEAMRQSADGSGRDEQSANQANGKSPSQSAQAQANASGQGQAQGQAQGQGQGQGQAQAQAQGQGQGPGQAKDQAQAQGQGQDNDAQQKEATAQDSAQTNQSPAQIADKEQQLSKEAALLAERLQRLAGKDQRVGHNLGNNAARAAAKMAAAGQALGQGNSGAAGEHGFQGELALRNVVDQLERMLKNQPEPTDIAHEDSPKEYDSLISEYLKRLSHAE